MKDAVDILGLTLEKSSLGLKLWSDLDLTCTAITGWSLCVWSGVHEPKVTLSRATRDGQAALV